eukprot:TRINITY_DN84324_c0_g1_i1.p1 TRINITY_DN84324_c0_g1~~TRINITY_DN84324_c0_g1_i1.p1  ORF type:complete len:736 (-),score=228.72 TRINITY_DN84324_c0_g1_i1:82-2289(-)
MKRAIPFCLAVLSAAESDSTSKTPVENVIDLLSNLKAEVTKEGEKEAKTYGEFSKFCSETEAAKNEAIKMGELQEQESSGTITSKQSDLFQANSDITQRQAQAETLSREKDESVKQCTKAEVTYDSASADLTGAIIGLEGAIEKLAVAKETNAGNLLQFGSGVEKSLKLAEVMGFLKEDKKKAVSAFLQGSGRETPAWLSDAGAEKNKQDYAFQSDSIVSMLQDLLKQFRDEKSSTDDAWAKTHKACEDTFSTKTAELDSNDDALKKLQEQSTLLSEAVAEEKSLLLKTQGTLKDNRQYLQELKQNCGARAQDFDQRSKQRAGEVQALQAALGVFQDKVQGLDTSVNGRAEAQVAALLKPNSFLQLGSSRNLLKRGTGSDSGSHESHGSATSDTRAQAEALCKAAARHISQAGVRLNSARLSGLAVRVGLKADDEPNAAANPLETVKGMVQKLVNDLLAEAQAEATQKGSCDVQLGKAKSERKRRMNEASKLSAKLQALESKRVQLKESTAVMNDELARLRKDLVAATELRTKESEENRVAIEQAKEGASAVKAAVDELQAFYKKAAKTADLHNDAMALVQTSKSKQTPADAGFVGSYSGKHDASTGIVSMMKVIQSDFEKTVTSTKASEEKAAEEFSNFKSESNSDIGSKETGLTLNADDLAETLNKQRESKANLKNTMNLLDGALQTLEDLKPSCVDNTMSYEERKAKRDQEVADLKTALCLLDTNSVEPECQ